jgi:ParB family chromosome partitioning protein
MSRNRVPARAWQGLMQANPEDGVRALTNAKSIATELIHTDPRQPRKHFDEEAMAELTASVKLRGILQPITVQKRDEGGYFVVTGERRLRAAREAGLTEVPALVVELTETNLRLDRVIENRQRKDLTDVEFAQALHEIRTDLTQEAPSMTSNDLDEFVGQRLGLSGRTVRNFMALLNLDPAIRDLLGGELTEPRMRGLARVSYDPGVQRALAEAILAQDLSGRQALQVAELLKADRRLTVPKAVAQVLRGEAAPAKARAPKPEGAAKKPEKRGLTQAEGMDLTFEADDPDRRYWLLTTFLSRAVAVLSESGADTEVPLNRQQVADLNRMLQPLLSLHRTLRAAVEWVEEQERLGDAGYEGEPLPGHLAVMLPFGDGESPGAANAGAEAEQPARGLRPVPKSKRA